MGPCEASNADTAQMKVAWGGKRKLGDANRVGHRTIGHAAAKALTHLSIQQIRRETPEVKNGKLVNDGRHTQHSMF